MVKIIHDTLGEFEGETTKEVQAKMRKAEREVKAKVVAAQKDYDQARLLATQRAYRVLSKKVKGERLPGEFYSAANQYNPVKEVHGENGRVGNHRYECVGGLVVANHYGYRLVGTVVDNAGFPIVVFLESWDHPGDEEFNQCLAVDAKGESIAFIEVPGVCPEDFEPTKAV